jgi:hypothetical protein
MERAGMILPGKTSSGDRELNFCLKEYASRPTALSAFAPSNLYGFLMQTGENPAGRISAQQIQIACFH